MSAHRLGLVAPWYRRAGADPRATAPAIQRYDTSRLVDVFLADPQRAPSLGAEDVDADGRLKLYLALHRRFYLVVCELHCDRLGFPDAARDDVCQAGFVVRRRRVPSRAEVEDEAARVAARIAARRADIAALHASAAPGAIGVAQLRRLVARQAEDARRLAAARQAEAGATLVEGWSSDHDGIGSWSPIEDDAPRDGEERAHPLFALVADPRRPSHPAAGRSLYFGVVPTATADADAAGAPQLDDASEYELRCFVRRHDPRCPRTPGPVRDCRGALTWSAPTDPFTLASPRDAAPAREGAA